MFGLPILVLMTAVLLTAQDPAGISGRWGEKPDKAIEIRDPNAEAAEEKRLVEAVAKLERLGADHVLLARPLQELGLYFALRKRYAESEPLLRRAVAILEKKKGPDHLDVATALINLAICRMAAGGEKDDQAGPMLDRAVAIIERTNKEDPEVARALKPLGGLYLMRREYDKAEPRLMRALAIHEKTSGADSPEAASVLEDLGKLHTAQAEGGVAEMQARLEGQLKGESEWDRHDKLAQGYYKRALAIYEKSLEPGHPRIAGALFDLGQLAGMRERWADAEPYLARWLKLQEAAKAPASTKQASAYFALAQASRKRKDWDEADRRLAMRGSVYAKLQGAEGDRVTENLADRSNLACEAGRFDDAEKHLRRALDIQVSRLGAADPDIVDARALMVGSYRDHVQDRRAPVLWRRLRDLLERTDVKAHHWELSIVLDGYIGLLRRTNRVLALPTEDDLAYLKKTGALIPQTDLDMLQFVHDIMGSIRDDAALEHVGRLYALERLEARGATDKGLAHIQNLVNLRWLSLSGPRITDAGLEHLEGLVSLARLTLHGTKVTPTGLARLRRRLPNLRIDQVDVEPAIPAGLVPMRPAPGLIPPIRPSPALGPAAKGESRPEPAPPSRPVDSPTRPR
jgi:tetratricopeptide (TPR) repeat protein